MRHLASTVLALFLALPIFATDAPMFRGNAQHSGVYDAAGIPQLTKVKWKFHTAGRIISSPAVVSGVVYFGSTDKNLYAVDIETGKQKWKFKTESRVNSSPAVDSGVVYFGSYDSNFYAVDAGTGKLKWKFKTAGERRFAGKHLHGSQPLAETMPDPFDCYLSSPTVFKGAVYFGSGDGNVYALDTSTGNLKWKFQTGDVVHASPAISEGTLYIGSWDTYFYALDAATGKEKWRFKTGEDHEINNQVGIQSSAVVVDGIVYFGCRDSNLYALDAKTGEKKWAFNNKGSWVISSPAVRDGKIYFGTSDTSLFYVADAKTGSVLFSLKMGGWPIFASPAIAGDFAYVGTQDGKLTAIDLKTQKPAWAFQTDASKENLAKYSKPDGKPNYEAAFVDDFYDSMMVGVVKMYATGSILASPVVVGNAVYVGSVDGNLYALN